MKSEGEYGVVSITCTVESSPASDLIVTGPSDFKSMRENKMNISKSDNKVTIYLNVNESDAGVYKCTAGNTEGRNHIEEELLCEYSSIELYLFVMTDIIQKCWGNMY